MPCSQKVPHAAGESQHSSDVFRTNHIATNDYFWKDLKFYEVTGSNATVIELWSSSGCTVESADITFPEKGKSILQVLFFFSK